MSLAALGFPDSPSAAGAVFALLAAVCWGGGDFAGGMGAKAAGGGTRGALRMMVAAHTMSLLVLALLLTLQGQLVPQGSAAVLWGLGSGVVAGVSLAAFYVALARGEMGASAAISGLLAAAIPAAVGMALEGRPTALRTAGFALAAIAIWMVAVPTAKDGGRRPSSAASTTVLAIAGGFGFGLYFTALKFANTLGVLQPLMLARVGSIAVSLLLLGGLWAQRRGWSERQAGPWLPRSGWWWASGVALLDSGGNLLYIAATRAGRLDVAAVLAALYPASTILLAAAVLHERPDRRQLLGMSVAVAAIVLVTL